MTYLKGCNYSLKTLFTHCKNNFHTPRNCIYSKRNIFPKEGSTESLTARWWEDWFFCTIWNIKKFKFPHGSILHSKIFPTSTQTPKSELKRRSYGSDKLEKKNWLLSGKYVATGVATSSSMSRPMSRQAAVCRDIDDQCRDKKPLSRPETL